MSQFEFQYAKLMMRTLDCQNKLRRGDIVESLDGKGECDISLLIVSNLSIVELANKIFYQSCHTSEDLQTYFRTLPEFLSQNKEVRDVRA